MSVYVICFLHISPTWIYAVSQVSFEQQITMKNYICTRSKLSTVIGRIRGWPYLTISYLISQENMKTVYFIMFQKLRRSLLKWQQQQNWIIMFVIPYLLTCGYMNGGRLSKANCIILPMTLYVCSWQYN